MLNEPWVIAEIGDERLLMERADVENGINTEGQAVLWTPDLSYSAPKPLQVWFKWLYDWTEVQPYPWEEPASKDTQFPRAD